MFSKPTALIFLLSFVIKSSWCSTNDIASRSYDERNCSAGYTTISTSIAGSVLRATINNPPINLYDQNLSTDLFSLINSLANQTEIKVVILASANPEFWIAHYDIHILSANHPPPPGDNGTETGVRLLSTVNSLATLPVVFIAEINGRAHGAGNEIAVQCDIRYAGPGTILSQIEVGFNILPGAGGLQYLVALVGRARALEYILSGNSVDAVTAASIGWVNKAFGSKEVLRTEVDALAHRIASFTGKALGGIKKRVNVNKPSAESLAGDNEAFFQLLVEQPAAERAVDRYLELSQDQTRSPFELALSENLERLND